MKAKLQIRNFGPIKNIDIEVSKYNILIGPHASGKSTIAKVLCIIQSFADFLHTGKHRPIQTHLMAQPDDENYLVFNDLLTNYRIESFILPNTYIYFEDRVFLFELNKKEITAHYKSKKISGSQSYYIPAERIALPMISESLFELTLAQSTLPTYFLEFGKDFTIARKNQKIFNIPLLDVEFEFKEGRNFITLRDNKSVLLEEASSAIQAILPLLVILQRPSKEGAVFVVEELESNSFPILQKKLLYYIIERMKHAKLKDTLVVLPTHSPYILSAINNLLLAAKIVKQNSGTEREVSKIINKDAWVEQEDFSAYYLENGESYSIVNEDGLIDENKLDTISEDLAGEFDALISLYNPAVA